jgi:hypothetical protein
MMTNKAATPKRERCAASWKRGQDRKRERVRKQQEAEARNRVLRARGEMTPWQAAKAAAKAKRNAAR